MSKKRKLNGFQTKQRNQQLEKNKNMRYYNYQQSVNDINDDYNTINKQIELLKNKGTTDLVGCQTLLHFDKGYFGRKTRTLQEVSFVSTKSSIEDVFIKSKKRFTRGEILGCIDSWFRKYSLNTSTESEVRTLSMMITSYLPHLQVWKQSSQIHKDTFGINLNFYFGKKEGIGSRDQMGFEFDTWIKSSHLQKQEIMNSLNKSNGNLYDFGMSKDQYFKDLYHNLKREGLSR